MNPIFAQITKVDEERREVTGRAVQEVVDRDNELFDYTSSKPEFMKWSAEVYSDTAGKSYGNVRSMHGNVAAGKLTDVQFNDQERAIDVTAKIVDDNEWKKVLEGVHTGFSIGGRYAKKWTEPINGKMVTRYTAVPTEVSIVDRPCIPTAKFFSIHKRDGTVEKRMFAHEKPLIKFSLSDGVLALDKASSALSKKLPTPGTTAKPSNTQCAQAGKLAEVASYKANESKSTGDALAAAHQQASELHTKAGFAHSDCGNTDAAKAHFAAAGAHLAAADLASK